MQLSKLGFLFHRKGLEDGFNLGNFRNLISAYGPMPQMLQYLFIGNYNFQASRIVFHD